MKTETIKFASVGEKMIETERIAMVTAIHIFEKREIREWYRVQNGYMKTLMMMPEVFIHNRNDRKRVKEWIEQGISPDEIIARFEVMMENSIAREDYHRQLNEELVWDELNEEKSKQERYSTMVDLI